jgi:hypothetical protein
LVLLALDLLKGPAQQHRQLVGIGRLEAREARLGEPAQRLADRLVGAAFGYQGDPGRGRRQDEPRTLVAGVVRRIMPALDERVVECPDRQQPRAEQWPGGELQEQVALGDAELDVLTLRRHRPALRRDDVFLAKGVGALGAVEDAAAVDPGPEIGRDRDVGRGWSSSGECRKPQ